MKLKRTEGHQRDTAPMRPLIPLLIGTSAIVAVLLNYVDGLLAREGAVHSQNRVSLAMAATSSVVGASYRAQLSCQEKLVKGQLDFQRSYRELAAEEGVGTEVDLPLTRSTDKAVIKAEEVSKRLGAPLEQSLLLLDEHAVDAANESRCDEDSVLRARDRAQLLVTRQNEAVRAAHKIGASRNRITMALTLGAISGAILNLGQSIKSARSRTLVSWTGAALLACGAALGLTTLSSM